MSTDPAAWAGYPDHPPRMGFFTDTSVCIGCKACEVACKEWNDVPDDGLVFLDSSYDNTGTLGASTWRHVAFIEQRELRSQRPQSERDRRADQSAANHRNFEGLRLAHFTFATAGSP